eukprot:CAMPEP_0178961550 /NCGR_PEP_ID=MMETSP0789-20121207/13778_1 /TAXON_ID=3005 /ORGANISM="Rhizosolenia setigera, Strain CCMP 1694" /LENGTH=523 /DNA_ID=CAMNT_0020645415 /DNA_START=125 /DNA_END=1696 /DNA_ORIENTATION=-
MKDSQYYSYPGFINPNTYFKMYWDDSYDILEDIDQFDHLYISYHKCVWSAYENPYGESGDGGGDESDYWYLGAPQKFRANAAFSLYGSLKGQGNKGCKRSTFINSFFTKGGVETIASPFSVSTTYANSYCSGDGSGDRRDRNLGGGNDDDYSYSEGTGCSAKGTFVRDSFGGSYCDGSRYLETLDLLEDFNEEMNGIVCKEIWDGSTGSSLYTSTAYQVLTQSSVCDLSMYPSKCPDPHGLLRQYNHNFKKAISLAKMGIIYEPVKRGFPYISFSIGLIFVSACMIGASFYVKNREAKNPVERQMAAAQKALEEDMQVDVVDDVKPSPSSASKMSSSPLKEEVVGTKPVLLQFGSGDSPTKSASVAADPGPAPEVAKTTSWAGSVVSRVRSLVVSDPEEEARKAQAKAQAEEEAAQAYREIQDAPLFTSPSSASNCPGCNAPEVEEGASSAVESVQEQSQQEESMSESHAGNVSTSAVSPVRRVEESLATEPSASQATEETGEIQTAPSTGSRSLFGKLRKKK